ncbi:phosphotransferase [Rossellomorea vietnamensis]|uniref:Phosphotransferase n=1 Tax=Rossellomorea vietnamensis TaxID=218284 RepID=A0A6I6UMK9_9BACI|nr:phosphotransferase [Rossellomorea vietnamensis]QHE59803.1 phosphotransferase [Rossellomorea vietnamensis]
MSDFPLKLKNILSEYDISKDFLVEEVLSGTINKVFRITYKGKTIVLRQYNVTRNSHRLNFVLESIVQLKKRGVSVPHIYHTKKNKLYVSFAGSYWYLMDYLEGQNYEYNNVLQLKSTVRELARLHMTPLNSLPYYEPHYIPVDFWFKKPIKWLGITKIMCEEYLKESLDEYWNLFHQTLDDLSEINICELYQLPLTNTHGDFHGMNMKFLEDQVQGMFDFDNYDIRPRIYDIGYSLLMLAREGRGDYKIKPEYIDVFFQEYEKNAYPLLDIEIELILPFMLSSHLPDYFYLKQLIQKKGDVKRSINSYYTAITSINSFSKEILNKLRLRGSKNDIYT